MVGVVLEKDVSEMAVNKIYDLAEGNIIADSREKNSEVSGSYWVFRIAAYSFLAIISPYYHIEYYEQRFNGRICKN